MKNWLIGGAVVFLIMAAAASYFTVNALDDDNDGSAVAQEDGDADAARCVEGAEVCDDTPGDDIAGICAEGTVDCDDAVDNDGASLGVCAPGVTDCVDTAVGGDDVSQICVEGSTDCNDTPGTAGGAASPERVTEIVFADLEARIDSTAGEITLSSLEAVEWPNSCLGVETPDIACAEVITPGFKVVLEQLGTPYVYHTDASGNAFVLVD